MGIKVGITGGIGSGKSYISRIFKAMGVPFYDADKEAKQLMNHDPDIHKGLVNAFGTEVYQADGVLDRKWLAEQVFNNNDKLEILNSIVHPLVIRHGEMWALRQTAAYSLKEAALLIESGSYKSLDCLILVSAPEELRIERVMHRDAVSRAEVQGRIDKQMPESEKEKYADFIVHNDGVSPLLPQILHIHQQILQREWSK
ncbi:dephospho-CoA kinase [Sphingobacterium tabacisoli]|uniref:Dephospho-CoA kinase n=1 Tax=Sphingobacterium tabacisoli TaxID=2044855 RepID=A0ABW5LB33_9SPHI|nr:dephospho-CoA kinase [Sphingobacterium tabacisoli]